MFIARLLLHVIMPKQNVITHTQNTACHSNFNVPFPCHYSHSNLH